MNTCHRRRVTREELIKLIQEEHGWDHCRAETLYVRTILLSVSP